MSNIKVGDLVMVVKPTLCCRNDDSISKIFTVIELVLKVPASCPYCGNWSNADLAIQRSDIFSTVGCDISRLKKIDPLSEPESITKDEEVPA